ncbi:hypothetical protein LADH09A_001811 [Micromonospora sp. LAH09]|uniref:hypothetical protein n=1 Tax=Micromonospora cabrerizensis TaxID=2911213 RepID=UPI001EE910D2|nr:hypothetical protein [Micromonospora cabrerizensis]MCG5467961.1 hypothetical protein [Micromonospora cabrerizensis]
MIDEEFSTRGGVAYVDSGVRSWGLGYRSNKNATWPLARLRVGTSDLTVTSLFGEFRVTRANLVSISRFGRVPVLADGVRFVRNGHDGAVIFWALRAGTVVDELQRRGWPVTDSS